MHPEHAQENSTATVKERALLRPIVPADRPQFARCACAAHGDHPTRSSPGTAMRTRNRTMIRYRPPCPLVSSFQSLVSRKNVLAKQSHSQRHSVQDQGSLSEALNT